MEKQLPKNWVETTLKNTTSIIRGVSYKKNEGYQTYFKNSVLILRGGNIQDGDILFDTNDNIYVDKSLINENQYIRAYDVVIVGSTGSRKLIGKAATVKQESSIVSFGAFLMLLRTNIINKKYHSYFYQTRYYRNAISELAGGVNINNIRKEYIEDMIFPLPPLAEQKRIAEKLDALFGQLDSVRGAMSRIPTLLANLRQQILTHAVTGKLTQEWRQGKNLEEWEEKSLSDIAIPKSGYPFNASDFTDYGIQVIRMGNLYNNKLSLDRNPVFLPNDYDENIIKKSAVKKNDILLTLTGTKYKRDYGYAIKIEVDDAVLLLNQRILSLTSLINPNFLLIALRGDQFRDQFFSFETGGVNQGNVGVKNVMTIALDIPPVEEQTEIANRVQSLFEKLDSIEQRYQMLKTKLENLPQAILHKAFKGELVEQLPTDGNAIDLLREIELLKKSLKKK